MDWKQVLKREHPNDQALQKIMEFFEDCGRRVNENELTLMGFRRFRKARRDTVAFSTETIGRKARLLAEMGLLNRGHDDSGHTWYEFTGDRVKKERVEYFIRDRNGNRIQVV